MSISRSRPSSSSTRSASRARIWSPTGAASGCLSGAGAYVLSGSGGLCDVRPSHGGLAFGRSAHLSIGTIPRPCSCSIVPTTLARSASRASGRRRGSRPASSTKRFAGSPIALKSRLLRARRVVRSPRPRCACAGRQRLADKGSRRHIFDARHHRSANHRRFRPHARTAGGAAGAAHLQGHKEIFIWASGHPDSGKPITRTFATVGELRAYAKERREAALAEVRKGRDR
jgi:hypothetical protein